jgi:hypothetical protein
VESITSFGEQEARIRRFPGGAILNPPIARRDVDFAPQDWIDSSLSSLIVEGDRREHVSVLGNRERGHLEPHGAVEQFLDATRAIEQRVF